MRPGPPIPPADLTVDGSGLQCVRLLIRLRARITGLEPGSVVHVITTDPAAPLDLPAWCHLTGHTYLGVVEGRAPPVHALSVTARPLPTLSDRPWHPAPD